MEISSSLDATTLWKRIKLFLVGDSGVGKSSALRWLMNLPFEEKHISTDSADVMTIDVRGWERINTDIKESIATLLKEKEEGGKGKPQQIDDPNQGKNIVYSPFHSQSIKPTNSLSCTTQTKRFHKKWTKMRIRELMQRQSIQ